ncbi:hypothetical protein BDN70DRAFT_871831 [Pholiota conissans]|uniref:Uncharacterized protein n=1 Tax=Pholiota conissans TaxID=109636 RepID=A0A9P5ZDB6_9AGAR|nr:hypothetical protein BDN70DRAFT_871831 [Pholiota conissans]
MVEAALVDNRWNVESFCSYSRSISRPSPCDSDNRFQSTFSCSWRGFADLLELIAWKVAVLIMPDRNQVRTV